MTRRRNPQLSVKKRREAMRRKRQQQNRVIAIVGSVLAVAVIAFIIWMVWPQPEPEPAAPFAGTALEGERPLAALPPAERNAYYSEYPPMIIDTDRDYRAVIYTARGEMHLDLFEKEAPLTVNNFVFLANEGFYDNTVFHRVLEGFMAQGGDPTGTGTGGPGYRFQDETDNGLVFDRGGLLAMANSGPDSNGSQFFITFEPTPRLDGGHTIFGELVAGQDVLRSLRLRDPQANPDFPGDLIERVEILVDGE